MCARSKPDRYVFQELEDPDLADSWYFQCFCAQHKPKSNDDLIVAACPMKQTDPKFQFQRGLILTPRRAAEVTSKKSKK
jgi:hypothetical protein